MRKALSLILTLMLLFLLPAAAGASSADSTAKDVWIDNTVDNSVAIVIGQLKLTDNDSGAVTTEEVYREQVKTKYSSDPVVTEDVQQLMIAAASALKNHAAQKGYTVTNNETAVESSNGKVWDNRRYETVEDSDAVLIGDADYLQGAYGIDPGNYTRTHIASGDYGIEHIFTVTLEAETGGVKLIDTVSLTVAPPAAGQKRFSSDPAVTLPKGKGYKLDSAGWLEEGGGMSSVAEDYTFEAGKTYYRTICLVAEDGYAFASGEGATGNYEGRYKLKGDCNITGGELYTTAITGDYHSGTKMTVVVKVQPEKAQEYTVSVTSNNKYYGQASASASSGITGTEIILTAEPGSSYRFKEWKVISGGVTVRNNKFVLGAADVEIQAVFEDNTVVIALGATKGGSYAVSSKTGNVYEPMTGGDGAFGSMNISTINGDTLTLIAAPALGYQFKGWYEGVVGESSFVEEPGSTLISASKNYSFVAAEFKALCAVFEPIPVYTVTVTTEGEGMASAEPSSGVTGTEVALSAQPGAGYRFKEWQVISGGVALADGKLIIGKAPVQVKAVFEAEPVKNTYTAVEGNGASWTKGTGTGLRFVFKGSPDDAKTHERFTGIAVDGKTVAAANYTASAGSTVVDMSAGYLETLASGSHTLTANFSDGSAAAAFTVREAAAKPEEPANPDKPTEPEQPKPVPPASYDPGYDFRFSFAVKWQGDHEDSIDWTLYNANGTVAHKKFNKHVVNETEWQYEAWFASVADYYIVEKAPAGYTVKYQNVGAHAGVTDRCYNGGTIINYKVPRTGDSAPLVLWLAFTALGTGMLGGLLYSRRRKREVR